MKWFVVDLSKEIQEPLRSLGVFTKMQLLRMQDVKLVSEILFAVLRGVQTTKAEQLDALFDDFDGDDAFDGAEEYRVLILRAMDALSSWRWLASTYFVKSYHFLTLTLAAMHAMRPLERLAELGEGGRGLRPEEEIQTRLALIQRALDQADELSDLEDADVRALSERNPTREARENGEPTVDPRIRRLSEFVKASGTMTNTKDTRETRFKTFLEVVSNV